MFKTFGFDIERELGNGTLARTGLITTPHGTIRTPAFVVVGTKATVKGLVPEQVQDVHAQAVLANAYHLYLQPGHRLVEKAGGLAKFMHWNGPTFTDSGGFQVLSLGSGFKKVLAMEIGGESEVGKDDVIAPIRQRRALIDEDGVMFKSHIDGVWHRFTPEHSMDVQHALGADIIFAFDELTSLFDSYDYQVESLKRTEAWAERCLQHVDYLRKQHPDRPYQALFGVIQGAQHQDLRQNAARFMAGKPFDGFGIGGAIEKSRLGDIVRWANEILPKDKPKHLLGISEPDDIFLAVENGIDTFDCVAPTRVGRNGGAYTLNGRINITAGRYREDMGPLMQECACYTCRNYSRAYVHHLFRAHERLSATLMSIHNEHFIIKLVSDIRDSIENGSFFALKRQWLEQYYAHRHAKV